MSLVRAYEEVIDFLAAGTSPNDIAAFRPFRSSQGTGDGVDRGARRTTGLAAEERQS